MVSSSDSTDPQIDISNNKSDNFIFLNSTHHRPHHPAYLIAYETFMIILALFGAISNIGVFIVLHRIPLLRSLPMRPLINSLVSIYLIHSTLTDVFSSTFVFFHPSTLQQHVSILCGIQYFLISSTFTSIYWIYLTLTFMRICHKLGFHFYYNYKIKIVFVCCVFVFLIGYANGCLRTLGVFGDIEYNYRFLVCLPNFSFFFSSKISIETVLIGMPATLTFLFDLVFWSNLGNLPVPQEQEQVFNACRISFLFTLIPHTVVFTVLLIDTKFPLPLFLCPLVTIFGSTTALGNALCLILFNRTFLTVCSMMARGMTWENIQATLEGRRRRRFVSRRFMVSSGIEQYRFIETHV